MLLWKTAKERRRCGDKENRMGKIAKPSNDLV